MKATANGIKSHLTNFTESKASNDLIIADWRWFYCLYAEEATFGCMEPILKKQNNPRPALTENGMI